MRRCIINLTRLGDLLQTQPLIHALREQGDEVGLVCLENFAGAAALLQGLAHVAVLPGSALLAGLDRDWRACTAALSAWVQAERRAFAAEAVLNLTPTLPARLLSRMLSPTGRADGFSLDEHGFGQDGTPWATYVQAVSVSRGCSPFNLTDAFRRMAGAGGVAPVYSLHRPDAAALDAARRELAAAAETAGLREGEGYVVFQLGASNDARRWPTASFAALGRALREQARVVPVLTGSAAERPLAGRYFAGGGPGVDMIGRTDLPGLTALLCASRLLVTNDTGTMHLAAGLGVPLLALFLATAQPWDTGPYAEQMCCLEPRLDCHPCGFNTLCGRERACRSRISAGAAASLIVPRLRTDRWQPTPEATAEARVWLTRRDEAQFMDLASLSGDENDDRTVWVRFQRGLYRHFLDMLCAPSAAPLPADSAYPPSLPALSCARAERILVVLGHADGLLHLAREQGKLLAARPLPKARQAFLATCEKLRTLFSASPDFTPMAHLWRCMVQNSAGDWREVLNFFDVLRQELRGLEAAIRRRI